jgi:hypothetical protein
MAFRRFALSRAAVPPEVWKVFDFPRRSFALASGCARHWPWAEALPDRRASRRDEFPHCFRRCRPVCFIRNARVVLSYSLYHLFANTQAGARFATKTRQAIAFEQMKTRRTHVIVYAGGSFEIFETLSFVHLILALSPPVQARLRQWLEHHLPHRAG